MSLNFLSINRLDEYKRDAKLQSTISFRLMWLDEGESMVFVPSGVSFDLDIYPSTGWIFSFNELFYRDFLDRYPQDYNCALMAKRSSDYVFIPLAVKLRMEMSELADLLVRALKEGQSELFLQAYADLILLNANQAYVGIHSK
ncbi:hypothetical protein FBD94_05650 [Pedobacter hiemivivus]|uniref:Uncharacterized protein n=1 Tax=Pedobacter hiemivivus TaxID=2530454 RepID=A0A4R0NJ55_9SPHI|nr:hypothetical protein [Pedobacter hiemivivus]TCC99323.1 hypothetical protein EZ444_01195 [Pedobacter hiemivivus]TKC63830.1 hypothetical protein FBD94_05650 [Pedobacter hiemivivus]